MSKSINTWLLNRGWLYFFITFLFIQPVCKNASPVPGIPWVQFHTIDMTRPDIIGIDPRINLDTGTTLRDFSRLWLGCIKAPYDGLVEIEAECDDGLRLLIDRNMIIDGWQKNGQRRGSFLAQADGWSSFHLEYFQDGGQAYLRLYWTWQGHPRELIPDSAFAHFPTDRAEVMHLAGQKAADTITYENHASVYFPGDSASLMENEKTSLSVFPGPHLFIDDYLITEQKNIERVIHQPRRDQTLNNPLIKGIEDSCFQPFFTVSRRPEDGRFRIWYGIYRPDKNMSRSHLAYMESPDGLIWQRPMVRCTTPEVQFGSEVLDRGPAWFPPDSRYIYSYWHNGGMRLAVSTDGIIFRPLVDKVILAHDHDITNIWWDPLRQHYTATVSTMIYSERWPGRRRTTLQSYSNDLFNWSVPAYILYADPAAGDPGETQFYAMNAYLVRGPLVIGMVKVLRDDLKATGVSDDAFGRAHTSLAWSRDGVHWVRDQAAFFEPDENSQAWDHAHAWIDEQLIVDDQVYLYYGGYKQGHKKNRFEERQIGLVQMKLDRYVSRYADRQAGFLKTIPLYFNKAPRALLVNADVSKGEIRVSLIDAQSGQTIPGFTTASCRAVQQEGLHSEIIWGTAEESRHKLSLLTGREIQIIFQLKNAHLYAFEFIAE